MTDMRLEIKQECSTVRIQTTLNRQYAKRSMNEIHKIKTEEKEPRKIIN